MPSLPGPVELPSSVIDIACRYCWQPASETDPLISPCACSGTVKYVHRGCLGGLERCLECREKFSHEKVYKHDMPTWLPAPVILARTGEFLHHDLLSIICQIAAEAVWPCLLSFSVRILWSFTFFSDELLVVVRAVRAVCGSYLYDEMAQCPSSPLLVRNMTSLAQTAEIMRHLHSAKFGILLYAFLMTYSSPACFGRTAIFHILTPTVLIHRVITAVIEGQLIQRGLHQINTYDAFVTLLHPTGHAVTNPLVTSDIVDTAFTYVAVPYLIGCITVRIIAQPAQIAGTIVEVSKPARDAIVTVISFYSHAVINRASSFLRTGDVLSPALATRAWSPDTQIAARTLDYLLSLANEYRLSFVGREFLLNVMIRASRLFDDFENLGLTAVGTGFNSWDRLISGEADPLVARWPDSGRLKTFLAGGVVIFMLSSLVPRRNDHRPLTMVIGWLPDVQLLCGMMRLLLFYTIDCLLFPFYCGFLLDVALVPLFGNTPVLSSVFTHVNPAISVFVHWVVGDWYMFCFRRCFMTRREVPHELYLHCIRIVSAYDSKTSIASELVERLVSAFMYGASIFVFVAGGLLGLSFMLPTLLPSHTASNMATLQFPVGLLYYHFAQPTEEIEESVTQLETLYRYSYPALAILVLMLVLIVAGTRRWMSWVRNKEYVERRIKDLR